jgi:hypothetical protein
LRLCKNAYPCRSKDKFIYFYAHYNYEAIEMIIVEGMDNTGKTTLVTLLAKEFNLRVRKTPQEYITDPVKLLDWTNAELEYVDNVASIYDRFPLISEEVYGPIIRGSNVFQGRPEFQGWADKHSALIIYCRPSLERILDFKDREQMTGVLTHAKGLISEYDRVIYLYRLQGCGVVLYNYTHFDAYQRARSAVEQHLLR